MEHEEKGHRRLQGLDHVGQVLQLLVYEALTSCGCGCGVRLRALDVAHALVHALEVFLDLFSYSFEHRLSLGN